MIIQSIQAENVLRYAQMQLTNLPAKGLIGISGPNESGKTTIAEVICLALFGRSFSLDEAEIAKNIKWGAFSGSVTLEFVGRDGQGYRIVRRFDADGNHTAQLYRTGETEPLARGVPAVNQSIAQVGGFTYERFIDSFYLAQRNIAAPHVLRDTVKALAGVDTLERISAEIEHDLQTLQTELTPQNVRITDARRQRTDLQIEADRLPRLKTAHQTHTQTIAQHEAENERRQTAVTTLQAATEQLAERTEQITQAGVDTSFVQWQQHAEHLDQALQAVNEARQAAEPGTTEGLSGPLKSWLDDLRSRLGAFAEVRDCTAAYQHHLAWLVGDGDKPSGLGAETSSLPEQQTQLQQREQKARGCRVGVIIGFVLALLLAAGAWAALWSLSHEAEHGIGSWLITTLQLSSDHSASLFVVAAGLSLAGLVLLVWLIILAEQLRQARQEETQLRRDQDIARDTIQRLNALPSQPLAEEVAMLRQCDHTPLTDAVARFVGGPGDVLLKADAVSSYVAPLQTACRDYQEHALAVRERLEAELRTTATAIGAEQQEVRRLDEEIDIEETRLNKAVQLDRQIAALQEQIDEQTRHITVRQIAQELLAGTHNRLLGRFNLEMRHVVSRIMPLLTDGRYETLQVDPNLEMQVLSSEKRNFVGLNEISGGTYSQVMLAVRLALSQALITSSLCGAAFMILDEPFAFFDARRTQSTLETLPKVSNEIDQIWIIEQRFDDTSHFALHLSCELGSDVLIASGS